jgi:hypothetical protein
MAAIYNYRRKQQGIRIVLGQDLPTFDLAENSGKTGAKHSPTPDLTLLEIRERFRLIIDIGQ